MSRPALSAAITRPVAASVVTAVALASALCALPAAAQVQVLAGARGGVALPGDAGLPAGPMAGVDVTVRMHRLLAAEATLEQSLHTRELSGTAQDAWFTAWSLGLQYRLDVAQVVPYAVLGVEGTRETTLGRTLHSDYGAVFGFGFFWPLGRHLYWGAEARYGIGTDGAFPTRQAYLARLGWRSAAF